MPLVPAICTQCGSPIEVDNAKEAGICPHCGTAFITEKVVNNYVTNHVSNTTVSQTIVKNIYGREKTEAEEYVARGLSFLGLGKYMKAADCFLQAIELDPGNAENYVLLARAQSLDFRIYYLTFHTSAPSIEKTAHGETLSALQQKYGYSFQCDKDYWQQCYRQTLQLMRPQGAAKKIELLQLGAPRSLLDHNALKGQAKEAIYRLYSLDDFTMEERETFFREYVNDFTDPQTGVLTVLRQEMFPQKDGYYDMTVYDGPVFFDNSRFGERPEPLKLRLCRNNMTEGSKFVPCDAYIDGQGEFDISRLHLTANRLIFAEGITKIMNPKSEPHFVKCRIVQFPDSLQCIGKDTALGIVQDDTIQEPILFGKGLKRIEAHSFEGKPNNVTNTTPQINQPFQLPDGLEYLGSDAFWNFILFLIVLPKSLKTVESLPFGKSWFVHCVLCLCDPSQWEEDWNTWEERGSLNPEVKFKKSYSYFNIPNNTLHFRKSIDYMENGFCRSYTPGDPPEKRATLFAYLKRGADFDETKTEFIDHEKKKGCYIATAVYGSYDCPQVWTLRRYRDFSLRRSAPGRLFVKLYYAVSPTLVKLFGKQKWFCSLWKRALDKKIKKLNAQGFANTPYDDQ